MSWRPEEQGLQEVYIVLRDSTQTENAAVQKEMTMASRSSLVDIQIASDFKTRPISASQLIQLDTRIPRISSPYHEHAGSGGALALRRWSCTQE